MGLGGAQTLVAGIIEGCEASDDIYCYVLRRNDLRLINLRNTICRNSNSCLYDTLSIPELKRLISQKNIQILHCHLLESFFLGYLLKKLYFKHIKLIYHEHGRIFSNRTTYKLFLKLTYENTDLSIAVSKATRRKIIEYTQREEEKIKVIYNFVDLDKFNTENCNVNSNKLNHKFNIKSDDFVFGFAARIIKRKGWLDLLLAFKSIEDKNVKLLIVGDGVESQKLQSTIEKLNLNDKVYYLGYVDDILDFYSCLDCFVIPSHWEPMGLTEIEAQACGIPVIASNTEGLNEIVLDKETGLLFEPKNVKDLEEKIKLMKNDTDLRNKLITNGLLNVRRYSRERYLNELYAVYNELLSNR
jgi:L-malate glycosyltransferase